MKPRLPTQVTLTAVADNTLYEDTNASAQVSNGAGPNFYVGDSWHQAAGLAIRRGVLQFDLSSIPANATIDSVTLTLHLSKTKAATAETVSLNRLLQNWGEGTSDSTGMGAAATTNDATWLDTFWSAGNPPTWTTPGGTFSSTVSASTSVANTVGFDSWTGAGLVADVTQWLSQPSTNFGWIVIGNEADASDSYSITVGNAGAAATTGAVTVTDTLPAGLTPTGDSGTSNGWTVSTNGQTVTATRADVLAGGASYPALTLTVAVANNAPAGVTNTASVAGGGEVNTASGSDSDPTTINLVADLTIGVTDPGNFRPKY